MDKHHRRTYRKRRNVIKKSREEEARLRRKVARQEGLAGCLEAKMIQLEEQERQLEEEERCAVHRASQLERGQYVSIARSLQPLLEQEAVLACRHLSSATLSHLLTSLAPLTTERSLPNTSELDTMISKLADSRPGYDFPTPPPPRSTSRRGSLSSLGSTSSIPRPSLSSLATSPSPLLPRPGLQRSLSQASDRPRRVSAASFSSQHSQTLDLRTSAAPDLHSEEFERSVEPGRPSRSRPSARPAFSTVKRTSSPWRAPQAERAGASKPPVWRAERPPVPPRSDSIDRMHRIGRESPEPGEGRAARHMTPDRELRPVEGGERSSSGSDSSGYCGSHDLLARADVHQEPASLQRRPSSSLSSFLPTSAPLRSPSPTRSSPGPPEPPSSHQPYYQDVPLPDPPTFVDTYIEHISAAQVTSPHYLLDHKTPKKSISGAQYSHEPLLLQAVLRAFPPSSPQSQGVIVPTRLRAKQYS